MEYYNVIWYYIIYYHVAAACYIEGLPYNDNADAGILARARATRTMVERILFARLYHGLPGNANTCIPYYTAV